MADCAMGKITASAFTTRVISAVAAGAACTVTSGASSFSPLPQPIIARHMAAARAEPRANPGLLLRLPIVDRDTLYLLGFAGWPVPYVRGPRPTCTRCATESACTGR